MRLFLYTTVVVLAILLEKAYPSPLDVVSNKTGEEQVKAALAKAERESEQAAKQVKPDKGKNKDGSPSSEKVDEKKVKPDESQESKDKKLVNESENKHEDKKADKEQQKEEATKESDIKGKDITANKASEIHGSPTTTRSAENDLEDASNKRMTAMARKLSTLVSRFQKKIALNRLNKAVREEYVDPGKKTLRGKTNGLTRFITALKHPLRPNGLATGYKEDTRLEDRLAMEAEEERKFNNGETYDDHEDYGLTDNVKSYAGTTSLSPKEQASQEMQSYNALISSESNRELSQIQDEITKSTQNGMGQVSINGEHSQVATETPAGMGGNDPLAGLNGLSNLGGDLNGALNGLDSGANGGSEITQAGDITGATSIQENGAAEQGAESQMTANNIQPEGQMSLEEGLPGGDTGAMAFSQSSSQQFFNKKRSKIKSSPSHPKDKTVKKQKLNQVNSKRKRTFVKYKKI